MNFTKFFWPKSMTCNIKNGEKSSFELGKSLKLPKMLSREFFFFCKIDLFDFTRFLPGLFLACCGMKSWYLWEKKTISLENMEQLFVYILNFFSCGYWHIRRLHATPTSSNDCWKNVWILEGCWVLRSCVSHSGLKSE